MIPVLMKMKQYRHVEIDLIYCPASRRPERAKWGKGMHSWIFYHFGPKMEVPRTRHVPRQSFIRLLHATLKDKPRRYYDGFMYGGHSNAEKLGLRPIRLGSIQQFARFLRRHKYYFPVIAFDSCYMGNEGVVKHLRKSCEYLLAFPTGSPYRSLLQTPSLYKHGLTHTVGSYLKRIALDFMKHIRTRMKYPCVLLFHIPAALRVYRLMHSLEKRKLIHRLEENDKDCREKLYVHDPYVAKQLRKEWNGAVTDRCGHLIVPCRRHPPLHRSQRHAHHKHFHRVRHTLSKMKTAKK
jgi:hypothetical protein